MNDSMKNCNSLHRDIWCICGLPVDNVTMEDVKNIIYNKAKQKGSSVFSTVNLNWVVQSFSQPLFREAINKSDIVTIDGKPLLWYAKYLGCPMGEVVAGSTLIQELNEDENAERVISIFFFGGEEGAGEKALENVNARKGGLSGVGALNPGFGTIEEMSSKDIIATINRTHPDILLVALGAKKGMYWIEKNRNRLNAKIVSHLGATINFLAGTVQRAPKLISKLGMEWLWRIYQEPILFKRYAYDGLVMLRFLLTNFLSLMIYTSRGRRYRKKSDIVDVQKCLNGTEIKVLLGRCVRIDKRSNIREVFSELQNIDINVRLDFKKTKYVDSAFMGLLIFLIEIRKRNNLKIILSNVDKKLENIFKLFCIKPNNNE